MAWTSPRTWTTGELVTAAMMNTHVRDNLNYLAGTQVASDVGAGRTFTNTSYLDLDALTGGAGTISAIAVTVDTGTRALVHLASHFQNDTAGQSQFVGYRVSGATTLAADDDWSTRYESGAANDIAQLGMTSFQTGLTAGANTFEVQARVTGGTGTILRVYLAVTPL